MRPSQHADDTRGYTAAAVAAVLADEGSHDQRQHRDRALKRACPACPAVVNERCHAESYPSGRPRAYAAGPHLDRVALADQGQR